MARLLVVETSPRGEHSISRNMTRLFVTEWRAAHPGGDVVVRDLMETDLQFVNAPWLQAYFTPAEQHSPEMKAGLTRMKAQGLIKPSADTHAISVAVLAAIQGGILLSKSARSSTPLELAFDMALSHIEHYAS